MKTNIETEFCIQQEIMCSFEMYFILLASLAKYVATFLVGGCPGRWAYQSAKVARGGRLLAWNFGQGQLYLPRRRENIRPNMTDVLVTRFQPIV